MKKLMLLFFSISLCSCSDSKNLLNLLFPSSLAIDYIDGNYEIAFQIDNFNSIAKTELEVSNENTRLLVVTGKGKTIEEAILNIEQRERSVIDLSHVKTIILKKNAINEHVLKSICHFASYNQELRLDSEVYYTENEYKELFSTSFQVSRSQLYILINSSEFQRVSMVLNTINLIQLTKALNESVITIHIPILEVADTEETYITQDGDEQQKVYNIKEVLYINQDQQSKIKIDDLQGIQWIKPHRNAVELNLVDEVGEVNVYASNVTSYIFYNPNDEKYYLKGKVDLVVSRDSGFRNLEELQHLITKKVHDQIMHTYLIGVEKNTDIYNIYYQSLAYGKDTPLTPSNFINHLKVDLHIKGSYVGAY